MTEQQRPIGPDNRIGLRRLAKDSLINLFRQGYSIIMAMIISILLARGLGKEARGIYTLCLLLSETLVVLLNLGISASSVYYISRQEYPTNFIINQSASLANWISLIAVVVGLIISLWLSSWILPGIPLTYLILSLLVIPWNMHNSVGISIFQGLQDFRSYNIPGMLNQVVMLGSIVLLVWILDFGVVGAILSYLIGAITTSLSLFILVRRKILRPLHTPLFPDPNFIRSVIQYGIKAHLSNILGFLSYRLDNFILNGTAGAAAVGIYSIAYGLGERLWLPGNAISTTLFPRIASLHKEKNKQNAITPLVARVVFWVTFSLALVIAVTAKWLIPLFYSSEFQSSVIPFLGILPGILFLSLGKVLATDIAGRGRVDLNLFITGIGFLANLLANLILTPRLGPLGAAMSSSISYILLSCLFIYMFWKLTAIHWQLLLLPQKSDLGLLRQAADMIKAKLLFESKK